MCNSLVQFDTVHVTSNRERYNETTGIISVSVAGLPKILKLSSCVHFISIDFQSPIVYIVETVFSPDYSTIEKSF